MSVAMFMTVVAFVILVIIALAVFIEKVQDSIQAGLERAAKRRRSGYLVPAEESSLAGKPRMLRREAGECFVCGAAKGCPCDATAAAFFSVEQLDRYPSWGPGEEVEICPRRAS